MAQTIAEHTARRGGERVGRTGAGQSLEEEAPTLAVVAPIRHRYTNCEGLLMSGYERSEARVEIHGEVDRWPCPLSA